MTRYKCDICGKKHNKMHITMECPDCYLKGCKIELDKQRKQFLKVIQKLKKNGEQMQKNGSYVRELQTTN